MNLKQALQRGKLELLANPLWGALLVFAIRA